MGRLDAAMDGGDRDEMSSARTVIEYRSGAV